VLFVYIPQRWAAGFVGAPDEDFDLHDHFKAFCAVHRLPVQLVREDKALAYPCRASVMWRIGLALYAKAGGVPWKLADTDADTCSPQLFDRLRTRQRLMPERASMA
jgi:hypothetical protein